MQDWLKTRGRRLLSLLSDIGGALGFVVLAVGLLAAAVVGAVLVAVDVFPQPFFTLLVLGVALLAAGLALHFLRGPLTPPLSPETSAPPQQKEGGSANSEPSVANPYSRAALMQRQHDEARVRKAIRRIREELRDNRRAVQRADEGEMGNIERISFRAWCDDEETLLELVDPVPHSSAREAYRELEGIRDVIFIRESRTTLTRRKQPRELLETDVHTTFEAIDEAVQKLGEAEKER